MRSPMFLVIGGASIVREEDYRRICKALGDYAVIHSRRVFLTEEDTQRR